MKHLKTVILISLMNFILLFGAVWYANYQSATVLNSDSAISTSQHTDGEGNAQIDASPGSSSQQEPSATAFQKPSGQPQVPLQPSSSTKQTSQTPPPPPVTDNRCLVTVQGKTYDVTQFRLIHSGGNIFKCGTDMTATFFSQHDQQTLSQLAKYLNN